MISKDIICFLFKIFLLLTIFILIILLIINLVSTFNYRKSLSYPIVSLNSDYVGPTNISKQINTLKSFNPCLNDLHTRLLCLSRYIVTRDNKLYMSKVVNSETQLNILKENNESVILVQQSLTESIIPPESLNFIDYFSKFDFSVIDNQYFIKLTELEKCIIKNNRDRILQCITNSEFFMDKELINNLTFKYFEVFGDTNMRISSLDLIFARFVIYFLIK